MPDSQLKHNLTLFDMTMIATGSVIGSGIFLTPAIIVKALPSPMWILGVWIAGGIMALTGALTFAELGSMMPKAGGVYVFLSETYGKLYGIFFALTAVAVIILRKRIPYAHRPYRTFGYPITPIIFIAIEVWFVLNTQFEKPAESFAGIGFIVLGIPV